MSALRTIWATALLTFLAACGSGVVTEPEDRVTGICADLYPLLAQYDDAMVDRFAELEEEANRLGIDNAIGPLEAASRFLVDPPAGADESFFYEALVGISEAFADAGFERCANLASSSELAPPGADLEAIGRNRRLWDEEGPDSYLLRMSTGKLDGPIRTFAIEVSDGEAVRISQFGFAHSVPLDGLPDLPLTVDDVFELIGEAPGESLRMDHTAGNPISYSRGDSWFQWEVVAGTPDQHPEFESALETLARLEEDSYWLTYIIDCACPEDAMSPISIQVVDGRILTTSLNAAYNGVFPDYVPTSLPELVEVLRANAHAHDIVTEWETGKTLRLIIDPLDKLGGEETILSVTISEAQPQAGIGQLGTMQCGSISAPLSNEAPALGDTADPDLDLAIEWFRGNEEGRFFVENVAWSVWEKTDDEMILYGHDADGYLDARFVDEGEGWRATNWGGCSWRVTVEGWGVAEWRVDAPIDAGSTTLTLAATERNCANGEAPEGRDVESVVWEDDESVTVFIFVEPVSGAATCQGNPEFSWTIDLDQPLGERILFDGSGVPPVEVPRS